MQALRGTPTEVLHNLAAPRGEGVHTFLDLQTLPTLVLTAELRVRRHVRRLHGRQLQRPRHLQHAGNDRAQCLLAPFLQVLSRRHIHILQPPPFPLIPYLVPPAVVALPLTLP